VNPPICGSTHRSRPLVPNFRVTPGPWTPEAWAAELELTTKHVKRWFQEATSSFEPPTDDGCRFFAQRLIELGPPLISKSDAQNLALRYGKLFLKHVARERQEIEMVIRLSVIYGSDTDHREKYEDLLSRLQEVRQHLNVILEHLSARGGETEPIRFLGDLANELWKETNQGLAPDSVGHKGPLCRLLEPALTAVSRNRSRETISEVLRGRRRKPRMGKIGN
jgi:hypothetical protein